MMELNIKNFINKKYSNLNDNLVAFDRKNSKRIFILILSKLDFCLTRFYAKENLKFKIYSLQIYMYYG